MSPTFNLNHVSKYKAKRTLYNNRWYASKREADYAAQLDTMMKARGGDRVTEWTPQVRIPIKVRSDVPPHKEVLICHYVCDFAVTFGDGRLEHHETKGFWTAEAKLKWKLVQALYPNMVFKEIR